jgi:hypothetical protein
LTPQRVVLSSFPTYAFGADMSPRSRPRPGSFVAWIDFSESDQRVARDCLQKLGQDEGTLDELGLGIMRDAFSALFFPGTSTLMNNARYLIFVPTIFRHIEDRGLAGAEAESLWIAMESQLSRKLPPGEGTFGSRAIDHMIDRWPGEVYWRALINLGILLQDQSQAFYFDGLRDFHRKTLEAGQRTDDGTSLHVALSNWDRNFPYYRRDSRKGLLDGGDFRNGTNHTLLPEEAEYLRIRYLQLGRDDQRERSSLMAFLLQLNWAGPLDHPWDAPAGSDVDTEIGHARQLSLFGRGLTLLYHLMLVEARTEFKMPIVDPGLAGWAEEWFQVAAKELDSWDLEEFSRVMADLKGLRKGDLEFIASTLQRLKAAPSASAMLSDHVLRGLIRVREEKKRGPKRRLSGGRFLLNWKTPKNIGPFQFNYRAPIGTTFVTQITEGRRTSMREES